MRIRRKGKTNIPPEIAIGGCIIMLDATQGIQLNPSAPTQIARITNLADPANPGIQATGSLQPLLSSTNGYPHITFQSNRYLMLNHDYFYGKKCINTPHTTVSVMSIESGTGYQYWMGIGSVASEIRGRNFTGGYDAYIIHSTAGNVSYLFTSIAATEKKVLAVVHGQVDAYGKFYSVPGTLTRYVNGVPQYPYTTGGSPVADINNYTFGNASGVKYKLGEYFGSGMVVKMYEHLEYDRTLSASEVISLDSYLKSKWGVV